MAVDLVKDEQQPFKVEQNHFINRALNATPRWATAIIGIFVGLSVTMVFVLFISGLQGPVTRIANAYAAQIEQSASKVDKASDRLSSIVDAFNGVLARLALVERKTDNTDAVIAALAARIVTLEGQVTVLNSNTQHPQQAKLKGPVK